MTDILLPNLYEHNPPPSHHSGYLPQLDHVFPLLQPHFQTLQHVRAELSSGSQFRELSLQVLCCVANGCSQLGEVKWIISTRLILLFAR